MTKTAAMFISDQVEAVAARAAPLPVFCTIARWTDLTGMSRRAVYEALGRGDLVARKRGEQTLIDVDHGLRWLRSLPVAQIKAPKRQQPAEATT